MFWETPSSGGKGTWPSAYSEGLTECLLSVVCRQFLFPGPFAGIKLSPSLQPVPQLLSESSFFKYLFIFIYLAVLGLSIQDLQSFLQHTGSLVVACELLVMACGD